MTEVEEVARRWAERYCAYVGAEAVEDAIRRAFAEAMREICYADICPEFGMRVGCRKKCPLRRACRAVCELLLAPLLQKLGDLCAEHVLEQPAQEAPPSGAVVFRVAGSEALDRGLPV